MIIGAILDYKEFLPQSLSRVYLDIVIDCCLNLLNILNIVEYCGICTEGNYHGWVINRCGAGHTSVPEHISISVLVLRI